MKYYVYQHVNPHTGDVFYVGKGSGKRISAVAMKRSKNHAFASCVDAIEAAGGKVASEIVARFEDETDAYNFEFNTICAFAACGVKLTNLVRAPFGHSGWKPTDDQRESMAAAKRGKPGNNRHRPKTAEWRAKIAASLTGRTGWSKGVPKTPEQREKIAASLRGRPLSEETRAKLSAIRKGKKLSPEHVAAIQKSRRATFERRRNALSEAMPIQHLG